MALRDIELFFSLGGWVSSCVDGVHHLLSSTCWTGGGKIHTSWEGSERELGHGPRTWHDSYGSVFAVPSRTPQHCHGNDTCRCILPLIFWKNAWSFDLYLRDIPTLLYMNDTDFFVTMCVVGAGCVSKQSIHPTGHGTTWQWHGPLWVYWSKPSTRWSSYILHFPTGESKFSSSSRTSNKIVC